MAKCRRTGFENPAQRVSSPEDVTKVDDHQPYEKERTRC